jgi:23S rRNA (cytidine2498-2'-O)-methyltransferase
LHALFADEKTVLLATRDTGTGSDWPMGVPRIRVGGDAPSRSAAKIAEAFLVMLGEELTSQVLVPGQRAVDLGAAPGGWSWWLAGRGMRVIAVDNGPLAPSAHATGMIDHVRSDGFRYRPRGRVEWLVCDMVEQPKRIAQLVAGWLADGAARHALFNLKLPMKKRLAEVAVCREVIEKTLARAGVPHQLVIKQLYHDREEVTALILRD